MSRALAEVLLKDKIITSQQFQEAVDANPQKPETVVRSLIAKKYLAEEKLLQYLSHKYGMPAINLAKYEVRPEIVS
jgi:hypothetical protein